MDAFKRFAFLGLLLLPLSVPLEAETSAATNRYWGIVSNMDTETVADKVRDLHIGWVRLTIYWNEVEPRRGVFLWDTPDTQIGRAAKRNLKLFITIHGTPSWANGGKSYEYPPARAQYWKDFLSKVLQRYGGYPQLRAIGMWNEPNLPKFWKGTPDEYVSKILIPGSRIVKQIKPSLLVAAPEMSDDWVNSPAWHISKFLNSGAEIDVVTQHVYTDVFDGNEFASFIDTHVKPYRGNRPVWITEAGHHVCYQFFNGEMLQKIYYKQILNTQQERRSWFTKIFPYRIWDPEKSCSNGNGYGITYGPYVKPRDAYFTYRNFVYGAISNTH